MSVAGHERLREWARSRAKTRPTSMLPRRAQAARRVRRLRVCDQDCRVWTVGQSDTAREG